MDRSTFVLLQLVVSGFLVLLQLSTIPVFLIYNDLRRRILYRIMLSIALSDFLQLFAIFQFTFYEFIGWDYSKWMEKFASGIFIIAWDHLIIQHFLLASNRLIIIGRAYWSPSSNKQESRLENGIFNLFLLISWLLMGFLQFWFMTPYCGGIWDREHVGFFYDILNPETLICSDVYRIAELYFTIVFPAISICCYLAIIVILKKTRKIGVNQNNKNNVANGTAAFNVQEKRILLISILLFTIITALIFAWYIDYKSPPWTLLFCGYLATNSILTLTMNSEYRKHFLRMWRTILHFIFPCFWQNGQQISLLRVSKNGGVTTKHSADDALFIRRNQQNGGNQNPMNLTTQIPPKLQRF